MEIEKEDHINEHENYFIDTSLNPFSYMKSPKLTSLSNIATQEIVHPIILPIPANIERVVADAYVYHKYYRSRSENLEMGT